MLETQKTSFREIYDHFAAPVTDIDCGLMCAPHNANGKPTCCDICQAVPAVYHPEWVYLQQSTGFWQVYRGDECVENPVSPERLLADTPEHMMLAACLGPAHCERPFRAISCRQFPFFPYMDTEGKFIGLAYEWAFETSCWVISNLERVTMSYRKVFATTYDYLFARWAHDRESYAAYSAEMRAHFVQQKRGIPLLHRDGRNYLLNPCTGSLEPSTKPFDRRGPYKEKNSDQAQP